MIEAVSSLIMQSRRRRTIIDSFGRFATRDRVRILSLLESEFLKGLGLEKIKLKLGQRCR
jgi:hypothetical protein